jgi:hypothetical protein
MKTYLLLLVILATPIYLKSQNNFDDNSEIVQKSLKGLKLIDDQWVCEKIFCIEDENEHFIFAKQVKDKVFAVSEIWIGNQINYYLNVFSLHSTNTDRVKLSDARRVLFNNSNFIVKNNHVNVFVSNNRIVEYQYDLRLEKLSNVYSQKITGNVSSAETFASSFQSPSGKLKVEFMDVNLILHKMKLVENDWDRYDTTSDTLISQIYEGSWSFGMGVWSKDETKFYFDNSGAVACIWELDLTKKTLNKIVPEHEAFNPIILEIDKEKVLGYLVGNSIMVAKPKQ